MNNHDRQFGGYEDEESIRSDRNVMNSRPLPDNLTVNTYYAEQSLHDRSDSRLFFSQNSGNYNMPFEDEDLLSGNVKPRKASSGEKVYTNYNQIQELPYAPNPVVPTVSVQRQIRQPVVNFEDPVEAEETVVQEVPVEENQPVQEEVVQPGSEDTVRKLIYGMVASLIFLAVVVYIYITFV